MIDPAALAGTTSSTAQTGIAGLSHKVASAIRNAAARTGVDFSYLLNKAAQESSFDPNAKASTSSATGLFQFTKQTWLQTLKQHGAEYGLGAYADRITVDSSGTARVSDPSWRQKILDLRKDPAVAAEMAGALDKDNLASLQSSVGGKIGATELYLAHFLGAGGASQFLNGMKQNPSASAAAVLPEAASANASVFYDGDGNARSLSQIYRRFAQKFDGPASQAATQLASAANQDSGFGIRDSGGAGGGDFAVSGLSTVASMGARLPFSASALQGAGTGGGSSGASSSSLFNTMVLAQMDMGKTASALMSYDDGKNGKRDRSAALSATAIS